jgi:hypothetical protein
MLHVKFSFFSKRKTVFGILYEQGEAICDDTREESIYNEIGIGIGIIIIYFTYYKKK